MSLQSSLTTTRSFFTRRYTVDYQASLPIDHESPVQQVLKELVKTVFLEVLNEAFSTGELLNMCGSEDPSPVLFRLEGSYQPEEQGEEEVETEEEGSVPSLPFSVIGHSRFKEFRGTHDIVYALQIIRDSFLPDSLQTQRIWKDPAIELHRFELHLGLFHSSFISNSLGFAPSVTERLTLTATNQKITLHLSGEGLDSIQKIPVLQRKAAEPILVFFKQMLNVDIQDDFQKSVKNRL